jgi:hypothetical protein
MRLAPSIAAALGLLAASAPAGAATVVYVGATDAAAWHALNPAVPVTTFEGYALDGGTAFWDPSLAVFPEFTFSSGVAVFIADANNPFGSSHASDYLSWQADPDPASSRDLAVSFATPRTAFAFALTSYNGSGGEYTITGPGGVVWATGLDPGTGYLFFGVIADDPIASFTITAPVWNPGIDDFYLGPAASEPGAITLAALGLAGLGARLGRRRTRPVRLADLVG